jgi:hypothetical protein
MDLGIEKDLRAPDATGDGTCQVRGGEVVEVLLGTQHRQVRVVQVQKGLQVGEPVAGP